VISLIAAAVAAPAAGAQPDKARPRSPVLVEVRRDGFHWADAGVGAAAALAIVAIAAVLIRGRAARKTSSIVRKETPCRDHSSDAAGNTVLGSDYLTVTVKQPRCGEPSRSQCR
jgi:hypothetical protein